MVIKGVFKPTSDGQSFLIGLKNIRKHKYRLQPDYFSS
jgi:hypothetical protein